MTIGTTVSVVPVQPEMLNLSHKQNDAKVVKEMLWAHFQHNPLGWY